MKTLKQVIALLLLTAVCLSAVACGKSENANGQGQAGSGETEQQAEQGQAGSGETEQQAEQGQAGSGETEQQAEQGQYKYVSGVIFYVNNLEALDGAGTSDPSADQIERVVRSYIDVMGSDSFCGRVSEYISGSPGRNASGSADYTAEKIKEAVSFKVEGSLIFSVQVTGSFPAVAETIAKAIEVCAPEYMDELTGVAGTLRVVDKAKDAVRVDG